MNFGEPIDDPRIDRAGDDYPNDPEEGDEGGERQDTPPLPTTHEEVLQNLERNGENANFLRAEAHRLGVDMDDKNQQIEPEGYPDKFISEKEAQINNNL